MQVTTHKISNKKADNWTIKKFAAKHKIFLKRCKSNNFVRDEFSQINLMTSYCENTAIVCFKF